MSTQSHCDATVSVTRTWENRSAAPERWNVPRLLTRSSELTREGLAMKATQNCSVDGCERALYARGFCRPDYMRRWKSGELKPLPAVPIEVRLAAHLERKPNGCLEWTGNTTKAGYGQISVNGKEAYTHRLAWGLAHPGEPLPPMVRHFVCDNPPCCDPEHLRAGTNADNVADMIAKGRNHIPARKTHCPAGHPYGGASTGRSGCRTCRIAAKRAKYDPAERAAQYLRLKAARGAQ